MTATDLPIEDQYRLVYQGICAVADRCDGAVEDDGVGFNGQDTLFGRRIASVPFEEWTDAVKAEAARIATKYQAQIERYTGLQVTTLPVVAQAPQSTVSAARDQARAYERKAKNAHLLDQRKAVVVGDEIHIGWAKKDPEFSALLDAVKRLPGRRFNWNTSQNEVAHSQAAVDFLDRFAFAVEGEIVVPEVAPAQASQADIDAWNAKVAAERKQIVLEGNRVRIRFDYDPDLVAAVRYLPGRQYDGSSKTNTADVHPEVLAFGEKHGFTIDPALRSALADVVAEHNAEQAEADLRKLVSGLANPADLPAEFVQRVLAACPKAQDPVAAQVERNRQIQIDAQIRSASRFD